MMTCTFCDSEFDEEDYEFCPYDGKPLVEYEPKKEEDEEED